MPDGSSAGYVLHELGRFEEALASFCQSAELRPDHAPTLYMRALVLKNLNKLEGAMADNLRAIELDPANADACNNMGVIVGDMGRIEEALSWYDRSLEIKPDVAGTVVNRARSLADLHRFDEAMAAYRQVIVIDFERPEDCLQHGIASVADGEFRGWLERARSALENSGDNADISETIRTNVARKRACRRQDDCRLHR